MASLVASGVTNDNWSFWDVVDINRPSLLGVPDQATVDQPYQAFDRGARANVVWSKPSIPKHTFTFWTRA